MTTALISESPILVRKIGEGGQIVTPHVVLPAGQILGEADVRHIPRAARLSHELHTYLVRQFVALLHVALSAAADEILPRCGASAALRHNVVDSHVLCGRAAVLASVAVSR